jgi:hypothetical protein
MSNLLDISEAPRYDESITKKTFYSYSPYTESYNTSDIIRISIQNQDLNVLPSESFLYIEGTLLKKDGNFPPGNALQFVNNCVSFLFDAIRYEINGVEIDHSRNLGITTSLKNYISLDRDESFRLLNAGWRLEDNGLIKLSNNGVFNFCVPLKMLLGFAEDYNKIIPNAKHELILIRARSNNNSVYTTTLGDDYKLNIDKIIWKVPHILLNDNERLKLYQTIQSARPVQMSFRSWDLYEYPNISKSAHNIWRVKTSNQLEKPRFIIFALQTNKMNKTQANPSQFGHCQLTNLQVHLNSEIYPYDKLNVSYEDNRFALIYEMYARFQQSYYGYKSTPLLDITKFKNAAPIVVVDCSHQNEVIKSGPVDVMIEFETNVGGIIDNTSAFCLLLHDRIIEYTPLSGETRKLV